MIARFKSSCSTRLNLDSVAVNLHGRPKLTQQSKTPAYYGQQQGKSLQYWLGFAIQAAQ